MSILAYRRDNVAHVTGYDPFAALELPTRQDLTDDEVRAAWRRIAAATHPDLPDGGDAPRFAAAAAAYAALRTPYGRTEAYADQTTPATAAPPGRPAPPTPRPATTPAHPGATAADLCEPGAAATPATPAPTPRGPFATATTTSGGLAGWELAVRRLAWRVRAGRPMMLVVRVLLAVAVCWVCVLVVGWQPATVAIAVGALTWVARTARYDLAATPHGP